MKWFTGAFIVALILVVQSLHTKYINYSAQEKWPGACTTGRKQSPINVITSDVKCNTSLTALQLSNEYYHKMSGTVENNGHSVEFIPHSSVNAVMTTPVGQYKLASFHMHWGPYSDQSKGSEHLVDNKASELEVHFVHVKQDAQDKTARDYYAVLSVRADGCPGDCTKGHIFTKLYNARVWKYRSKVSVSGILLSSLLPSTLDYYYYQGSLTTPSCDQTVQWFLLKNTIKVPNLYLMSLTYIRDNFGNRITNNYRLTQPHNGRIVTQVSLQNYTATV